MTNCMIALNDHFYYNNKIASAMQQFLPPGDRKTIQLWFDKLLQMDKTIDQMVIRSDYMWFILLMLQTRKLREPFTKLPPNEIPPLKKFVVRIQNRINFCSDLLQLPGTFQHLQVYEEVLISNEPNMIYMQDPSSNNILKIEENRTNSSSSSR